VVYADRVGNVREKSLVEIYREAPLFKSLRPSQFEAVGLCGVYSVCGGSRSRAALSPATAGREPLLRARNFLPRELAVAHLPKSVKRNSGWKRKRIADCALCV
jgi:hypothetical protein